MKALFKEIRAGDLDAVRARLAKDPGLVHAVSKGAPKSDQGQSPLQVALKNRYPAIAQVLLDHGADVDFMEAEGGNEWRTPGLHDAIRAAVMSSRYPTLVGWDPADPRWEPAHTAEAADAAFAVLQRMVEAGADVSKSDSFGNRALSRFALDARDVLPSVRYDDPSWVDPKPLTDELAADLGRISALLFAHGADPDLVDPELEASPADFYAREPVGRFLRPPA